MTFEKTLRMYRFYEALALYDAYYERVSTLSERHVDLGDALPIAWVPLVFHCTYLENLKGIFAVGKIQPGKDKSYVSFTELSITELTRFRSLRREPFEIAIGFPRALLESKGLYQPAYLKHAPRHIKDSFKDAPPGYVELEQDLGALHEVRVPGSVPVDDAVWVLSSKRDERTGRFDLPELKPLVDSGLAISFWAPSHQEGMIREPVFRKELRDASGRLEAVECCGRHYLPKMGNTSKREVLPPDGKTFHLAFPTEVRPDSLRDGWEGPFSKFEMAEYFYRELKASFSDQVTDVRPRIKMQE